jgi:shikimate kinase
MTAPPRHFNNIALIGFMGAGKSTVGHFLAEILGFELIDTDKVIESQTGRRISDIFSLEGEEAFRRLESSVVKELESAQGKVIATGGGLVMNPDNFASLRTHSLVACLWASPEVIYERVHHQSHRPLLQTPDPLESIRNLLTQRTPTYQLADLLVGVDFRSPAETARHIAGAFRQANGLDKPQTPGGE